MIDLTELRGSWNVAYIYNKESLLKAPQHHRKGLLLSRQYVDGLRYVTIKYVEFRSNVYKGNFFIIIIIIIKLITQPSQVVQLKKP